MKTLFVSLCLLAAVTAPAAEPPAPKFTKAPSAVRAAGRVQIQFAVDRETDVAVYIEDADGRIVRHLVAGVLGKNPPLPLKPDSLEQSVEWDGKDDDGKPAPAGPFKVRVGLGLRAAYAGQAFADKNQTGPNRIEGIMGLAPGPDGRLHVLTACSGWVWGGTKVLVFSRDGAYEKTIKPFPSNLTADKAAAAGAFVNSFGRFNPIIYRPAGFAFYPAQDIAHQMAVTPDGHLALAVVPLTSSGPRLALLDRDGGIPYTTYTGPALSATLRYEQYPFLAPAPDSRTIYLTGLGPKSSHVIHSVKLPDRGPAEAWFGEPGKPGNDARHLSDPRGLAADRKGRILVADFANNRVVVLNEKDRTFAAEFPVPSPNWLAVHPKTGAIYVQSGDAVIKFLGWENPTEQARLNLPKAADKKSPPWRLALDASADPPVIWAASGTKLLRCEDRGTKFAEPAPADCFPAQQFWRPAADPTRREVACKIFTGPYLAVVLVLNEKTGEVRPVPGKTGQSGIAGIEGRNHRLGPDGAVYAQDHGFMAGGIIRYDRDGKPKPFPATIDDPYLRGRLPAGFTGTTLWERDFSVDRHGDIYVKARGPEYHGLMTVEVYDQQGDFKRTALWTVSDGMYGPRVDPNGNLYIMEAVKAPGLPFPQEFKSQVDGKPYAHWYDWIYGAVVKFSPAGGAVWFSDRLATPLTYEGWRSGKTISNLRTTGGSLTGTVATAPATLSFPGVRVNAATITKIVVRLKNGTDGNQAALTYHRLGEGYIEACGPGFKKTIDIKPNSGFADYTFDMAAEKEWKGNLWNLNLVPTNGTTGAFNIDWVRIGEPDGKLVWNFDAEDGPDKKLPPTMKKEHVGACYRPAGATLQGALWWKDGFSPVGDMALGGGGSHCHCTGSDFDVDDFGRSFAPDTGRFRVGVLDTNGNEIMSFGAYGNQDCCGPDSYVLDPATKLLRPRKADDPKDLVSPFAKPDVAFAWIVGLAVTDRYAYVDDVINKRILRVKLDYSAEETCELK